MRLRSRTAFLLRATGYSQNWIYGSAPSFAKCQRQRTPPSPLQQYRVLHLHLSCHFRSLYPLVSMAEHFIPSLLEPKKNSYDKLCSNAVNWPPSFSDAPNEGRMVAKREPVRLLPLSSFSANFSSYDLRPPRMPISLFLFQ